MISDENLNNMLFKLVERRGFPKILLTRQATDEIILFLEELKQYRECELKKAIDDLTYAEKTQALIEIMKRDYDNVKIELKQYRECELRPAIAVAKDLTTLEQYRKIIEEIKELGDEISNLIIIIKETNDSKEIEKATIKVGLECFDVQTAVETLLYKVGFRGKSKIELYKLGLGKNAERGYYNEPVADQNKHRELDELSKAAAPLIELMKRKYNPHNKIIVTLDCIEVLSGEMGVPAEVRDIE